MRREDLYVREMIDAAQTVLDLIDDSAPEVIEADMVRRAAVLWNYTVLGEAANQLPSGFKAAHAGTQWMEAGRLRTVTCTAIGASTFRSLTAPRHAACPSSSRS